MWLQSIRAAVVAERERERAGRAALCSTVAATEAGAEAGTECQ